MIQGFDCRAPPVVHPLVELSGHRTLKAVDLGFQTGVPGDLPPSPQSVFQEYFILNTSRDLGDLVTMWATFGCGSRQCFEDGATGVPNTRVDIHTVEQFRVERNFGFQLSLEVGPVSAPDVRSIQWTVKGWTTSSVDEYREMIRTSCRARSQIDLGIEISGYLDV